MSSSSSSKSTAKATSPRAQSIIDLETRFGAANYHPLPVVIQRGSGIYVYTYGHAQRYHIPILICLCSFIYILRRSDFLLVILRI